MKTAVMEIDSSIASAILYLCDDDKDSYSSEIALSILKPALAQIPPLLEYMTMVISRFRQTEKSLLQGEHPLFRQDTSGLEGTINRLKEFSRIWIESRGAVMFLQAYLVQIKTILLKEEGEYSAGYKGAALDTLVGVINHANRVLGYLWMDIIEFPQSTRAIE